MSFLRTWLFRGWRPSSTIYTLYPAIRRLMILYSEPEQAMPWMEGIMLRSRLFILFFASFSLMALTYTYFVWMIYGNIYNLYILLVIPVSYFVTQLVLNIYLWGLENDFYSSLNMEYPIFLLIFAISSKINTYNFFHIVVDRFRNVLRATSRVLGRWIIDYELSESSLDDVIFKSLERLRESSFKFFIRDLVRVRAYSGEVEKFLETSLENLYLDISVNWEDSWKSTVGRLEMIILLFGLLPAIVMSITSIAPMDLVSNTFIVMAVAIPLVGYVTYLYLDKSLYKIPIKSGNTFNKRLLIFSFFLAILIYSMDRFVGFSLDFFSKLSISLAALLFYPSINSLVGWFRERAVDRDLSNFLFSIEDMMRNGFSIRESVSRIDLKGYSRFFGNLVGRIRFYLEYGESEVLILPAGFSRLAHLTMLLLSYISDIGGGLREIIFLRRMGEQYIRMKNRKSSYSLLPLLTAVFVVFLAIYNFWVLKGIFTNVEAQAFPIYMALSNLLGWLSTLYKTIILESILISGLLISKVIHDDLYHPYPTLVLLISYIFGLALFPF